MAKIVSSIIAGGGSGSGLPETGTPNALVGFDGAGNLDLDRELVSDPRDPMAHGEPVHVGVIGTEAQISMDPADYSSLLAGITGVEPTLADVLPIVDGLPIVPPQGRFTVPPCYIATSGGAAFQMNDANHKVDVVYTPECAYALPAIAFQINAVASAGTLNVSVYADIGGVIGSLLADLGTFDVTATGWLTCTFATAYQLYPGVAVHVVASRVTGDFSLYVRKRTTTAASEFPDGCVTRITTDGSTWERATQTVGTVVRDAFLAVVFAPAPHVCSSLVYGRCSGKNVPIPSATSWSYAEIPLAGIWVPGATTEALTASTLYYAYLYDDSGTLTIELATTAPTWGASGYEVKIGDAAKLLVARLSAVNQVSTYQGVVDLRDARHLRNVFETITKTGSKDPGYTVMTYYDTSSALTWFRVMNNADLSVQFTTGNESVLLGAELFIGSSAEVAAGIGVDSTTSPYDEAATRSMYLAGTSYFETAVIRRHACLSAGVHTIHALIMSYSGAACRCWLTGRYILNQASSLRVELEC